MRALVLVLLLTHPAPAQVAFRDSTADLGLTGVPSGNVKFADLDGDGRCDLVTGDGRPDASKGPRGHRVFLNVIDQKAPAEFRFVEKTDHGLPRGGSLAFADFDADGKLDCLYAPFLNVAVEGYKPPEGLPDGPAICFGQGDGTFSAPLRLAGIPARPHHVIAVGDVDRDGRLDFWLGSSYKRAPWLVDDSTGIGAGSDLALQVDSDARIAFRRVPWPTEAGDFASNPDAAAIPCYGGLIASLDGSPRPSIIELGYGRRVNRIWSWRDTAWVNEAPALGFDGDA
ncbi:MAG: VCBS repeat-containing protein, partial [Planctomycetota bacterium]